MHPQLYNLPGPDATNTPSTTIGPTNLTLYPAHCAHFGTPGHVSLPPPPTAALIRPHQSPAYPTLSRRWQQVHHRDEEGTLEREEATHMHVYVPQKRSRRWRPHRMISKWAFINESIVYITRTISNQYSNYHFLHMDNHFLFFLWFFFFRRGRSNSGLLSPSPFPLKWLSRWKNGNN